MAGARMGRERRFAQPHSPWRVGRPPSTLPIIRPKGYAPASFCVLQAVLRLPGASAPRPGIARGRFSDPCAVRVASVTLGVQGPAILPWPAKEAHLAWRVADYALVFVGMNRQLAFRTPLRLDASAPAEPRGCSRLRPRACS
jgi:hypothetical protein